MNILFMTLLDFDSINEHNIYADLLRKFYMEGHAVYVISPVERRKKCGTKYLNINERTNILKLKIGNIQKTNVIEKGISTVLLERKFITAIKRYFDNVKFDLVLYATPPITLQKAVSYVKKRDNAVTYLMLKDIFPQNAVDMGMLSKTGVKRFLYQYFRHKEKRLYRGSDYIGCMSEANVRYVREHNEFIVPEKVEVCPNCIEPSEKTIAANECEQKQIRAKYGIPQGKIVFVYGGNLGRPQGIDFIIKCINEIEQLSQVYVLIVGSGTEYNKLAHAIEDNHLKNTKLVSYMPKRDYDILLQVCHVGLIFLDYRFTIPNFPSRLLAYLDASLPVFAIVDQATDMGEVIESGHFGWSCESNNASRAARMFEEISNSPELGIKGKNGRDYLQRHYAVDVAYRAIALHLNDNNISR